MAGRSTLLALAQPPDFQQNEQHYTTTLASDLPCKAAAHFLQVYDALSDSTTCPILSLLVAMAFMASWPSIDLHSGPKPFALCCDKYTVVVPVLLFLTSFFTTLFVSCQVHIASISVLLLSLMH